MSALRVCLAGTWDPDFHRNRSLERLLARAGCEVTRCRVRLWGERSDAVVRRGKTGLLLRALAAYPLLLWRLLRAPRPDVVMVPYPGHLDMPLVSAVCRLRGIPIVFDVFISLFDTVVQDRRLADPGSMTGRVTRAVDRVACRTADLILADTPPHAEYFAALTGLPESRFRTLWVGVDESVFRPRPDATPDPDLVLFYGTYIPLHGLDTIVRAAKELEADGFRVRVIGDGQERAAVDRLVAELRPDNLERVGVVPLSQLADEAAAAGVCLGIFGTTGKAGRVVPNKVYQCLAVGRPVVTGDTPAIRSAFACGEEVVTVPVGDAVALAEAIRALRHDPERRERIAAAGHRRYRGSYAEDALATLLRDHLEEIVSVGPSSRGDGYQRARIPSG